MENNAPLTKPTKVVAAQALLWMSLLIVVFYLLREASGIVEKTGAPLAFVILLMCLITAPPAFVIYMIGKGKNWARIAYIVVFVAGLVISIVETVQSPADSFFSSGIQSLQMCIQLTALILLLQKDASAWFKRKRDLQSRTFDEHQPSIEKAPELVFGAEIETTSSDQPLLVLRYRGHQRILRIVLYSFCILIFGFGLIVTFFESGTFVLTRLIYGVFAALLGLGGIYALIEILLFKEIRLYNDRMAKEWHLIGTAEIGLKNATYNGRDYSFMGVRCLRNPNTRQYLNNFKIILFDQYMLAPKDLKELNRLLAKLSGRNVEEFEGDKVLFERLMKEEKS
jgi:uncharacterized membrane protein YuzA (DUF378 family)